MTQRGRYGAHVVSFPWECLPPHVLYAPLGSCLWLEGLWMVLLETPSKYGLHHWSDSLTEHFGLDYFSNELDYI